MIKWLSNGQRIFSTFVAMVTGCEGQRRNRIWASEIKLNQTTFAIRELCSQFTFLQWSYFYAKENKLLWEKRGAKENFYLLYCIFVLKNFSNVFKVPLWDHVYTQFLFDQTSVSLSVWCLEGACFQCPQTCTGEFKIRVLGCDFFCKLNSWLHNQQCLHS